MLRLFLSSFLALLFLTGSSLNAQTAGYYPQGGPDNGVEDVSLIQLIANPQTYDNKRIRIIGFVRLEFEGDAVYLHQEDFEYGLSKNGLWIDVPQDMTKKQMDAVNRRYAICTGTFRAGGHGHMGLFSGEIAAITRLEPWMDKPRSQLPNGMPPPPAPKR